MLNTCNKTEAILARYAVTSHVIFAYGGTTSRKQEQRLKLEALVDGPGPYHPENDSSIDTRVHTAPTGPLQMME